MSPQIIAGIILFVLVVGWAYFYLGDDVILIAQIAAYLLCIVGAIMAFLYLGGVVLMNSWTWWRW